MSQEVSQGLQLTLIYVSKDIGPDNKAAHTGQLPHADMMQIDTDDLAHQEMSFGE